MRWFRIYSEILDDEKVQMLTPELFKTWVNLLCVAATKDGILPPAEQLAFKLRASKHEIQNRIEDLIIAGLLDVREDKQIEPHNWKQRQWKSDDSAERVRKHRDAKRQCNGYTAVTETPSESSDTDTDKNFVSSTSRMLRESDEQSFDLSFGKGRGRKGHLEKLAERAEGLGLPVADFVDTLNKRKAKNRPAYFTQLCVNHLQQNFPDLEDGAIRAALWDKDGLAFGRLCNVLLAAEAA